MSLHRPGQWGGCWQALQLWQALGLDRFWPERLAPSRKSARWEWVLTVLTCYRLLALQGMRLTRETLLMKLGAAQHRAPKPGEDTEEQGQGD